MEATPTQETRIIENEKKVEVIEGTPSISIANDRNAYINSPSLKIRKSLRKSPLIQPIKVEKNNFADNSPKMKNPYTAGLIRKNLVELDDKGSQKENDNDEVYDKLTAGRPVTYKSSLKKVSSNHKQIRKSSIKFGKEIQIPNKILEKTKSELMSKSSSQKMEESNALHALIEKNQTKLTSIRENFYFSVEKKNEVANYIYMSGNYDSRNREVPWYIILPNGKGKIFWDVFVTFFLVYTIVIIPIDVGWNLECFTDSQGSTYHLIYTICWAIFLIDILVNFFTAVLNEKNQYMYSLSYIAHYYFNNKFFFDALAATPFDKLKSFSMSDCFQPYVAHSKIYLLFNLTRILKLGKYIAIIEDLLNKYINIVRIAKIFITLLYLAHFFGNLFCGNSAVTSSVVFASCSSMKTIEDRNACNKKLMSDNFISIYCYSVYIGIYFLVGNELQVVEYWERIYVITVLVIALGVNANVFSNVAVMLGKMSLGLDPFVQEKIDIMKEYMNFMRFESKTMDTIQEYHKNIWMKQRNMMYPEDFFNNLSSALHKLILLDQWRTHFFEISSFLPDISVPFFSDMLPIIHPKIFMKDDVIISEGEITTGNIYFIPRNCSCSVKIGGEWVRNMAMGEFFGEIAIFLRSRRRTATITCLKNSDFLSIEGGDFEKLLQDYPEDYMAIKHNAKDRLLSHIKLYPPKTFAKLVPKNDLKDYLIRRCIHLNDEEEDAIFEEKPTEHVTINIDKILPKLEMFNNMLSVTKNRLTALNKKLKHHEE